MSLFKNEVGRPSNKTILVRNVLKGILAIIIAGSIFAGGYFLNGNKTENSNTVISKIQAAKMLEKFNYSEFGYFYKQDRNVNSLDNYIILTIALNELPSETSNDTFTKKQVEKSVRKIFGDVDFKHESIETSCGEYSYDSKKEIYVSDMGCSGDGPQTFSEVSDVKLNGEEIIIINKVAFTDFDYSSGIASIYKDPQLEYLIKYNYDYNKNEEKQYINKYDSYKWKFIKGNNGNYIFKSVEKDDDGKKVTTTKKTEAEDVYNRVSVSANKVSGQNCYLEIDNSGKLSMKVRSFEKNGNKYNDVKVNGIDEKIVKVAVFALSNDASETFAAISDKGNLYLARFVDSESEINFEKQDTNIKVVDLEVVTDSADELKDYYDKGYVIFENDSVKHEIVSSINVNTNKYEFKIEGE